MKKILLAAFAVLCTMGVYSQGINFENSLDEAVQKAKERKCLVFVSLSINKCTPCDLMKTRVYPLKEVGDVYNAKFVNWKSNCSVDKVAEKLAADNNIKAFPTYVWLDPNTMKIVHKAGGSRRPADFIKLTEVPFDEHRASGRLEEEYAKGNRDLDLVGDLYEYYRGERDKEVMYAIERELVAIHGSDFKNAGMADFYFKHIFYRNSIMTKYLLKYQKKVTKLCGKERVLEKIAKLE